MHLFDVVDSFLQPTHKRDSIVVGTSGNNETIVICNIVILA